MDKQQGGREAGMEAGNFVSNPSEKCLKVVLREDDHVWGALLSRKPLHDSPQPGGAAPNSPVWDSFLMSKTQDPRHLFLEWQHVWLRQHSWPLTSLTMPLTRWVKQATRSVCRSWILFTGRDGCQAGRSRDKTKKQDIYYFVVVSRTDHEQKLLRDYRGVAVDQGSRRRPVKQGWLLSASWELGKRAGKDGRERDRGEGRERRMRRV